MSAIWISNLYKVLWCEFGYRPLKNVWVVMLFLKPKRLSKKTCNVLLLLCKCAVQKTSFEFVIAWFNFHMCNNISSIVEFQRWCVLKSMFFFTKNQLTIVVLLYEVAKKVPTKNLVSGIGDVWRFWMIPN